MELAAAVDGIVETVAPVDTEQTDHREEDSHTEAGGTLDLERVEVADVGPAVTALEEAQYEDRGLRLEDDRIAELDGELVVDVTGIAVTALGVRRRDVRGQRVILITAHGDDIATVHIVARHTVAADLESLERGIAPIAVVVTEVAELGARHQDEVTDEFGVDGAAEFPFVVFDPLVALLGGPVVVVDILPGSHVDPVPVGIVAVLAEEGERRRYLEGRGELGTGTGIDHLVRGVTRQAERIADIVGDTVVEHEVTGGPVRQAVGLPADVVVEDEVVIGPFEAVAQAGREAEDLEHLVLGQDTDGQVGVGHSRIVTREREGRRLFAEEPGLREAGGKGGIVGTVRLEAEGQVLGVAERDRAPGTLVEHTARREVVEAHAGRKDEGIAAPAAGELQLGRRFLLDVVDQVDGVVGLVREHREALGLIHRIFRIELPEGRDFTDGTLEVGLAVELARAGEDLPADDALVREVVAVDDDLVQGRLLALDDAHFHIDGVLDDIDLHGRDVEEEVAVVRIEAADGILILLAAAKETVVHRDDVINIALLDLEDAVEDVGGIDGIARPGHVAEIVALTFIEVHVDGETVGLDVVDAVTDQAGVAVAALVEGLHHRPAVVGILLLLEFLAVEEVVPAHGLRLLHRLGQLVVGDVVVAGEVDVFHADTGALVDVELDADGALDDAVALDVHVHVHLQETLLLEIALDDVDGRALDIVGEFAAAAEMEPLVEIFLFTAADAGVVPAGHSRALGDVETEPGRVAGSAQRVDADGDVLKVALLPQTAVDGGNLVAGKLKAHTFAKTGDLHDLVGLDILVAGHADTADDVGLRSVVVDDDIVILRPGYQARQREGGKKYDAADIHSQKFKLANIARLFDFSVSSVPAGVFSERLPEGFLPEIGPEDRREVKFGIGCLPEQIIGDALLA